MGEKTLLLDNIGLEGLTVLGITQEEIEACVVEITSNGRTFKALREKLQLTKDEIWQAMAENQKVSADQKTVSLTMVIVNIWKKRGERQISLEKYIETRLVIEPLLNVLRKQGLIQVNGS